MSNPGTAFDYTVEGKRHSDAQPAVMSHFKKLSNSESGDWGGVHINSGIPNHAFYLAAIGLGGHAWEKAGRIWYETLRDPKLKPNTGFTRFARLTATIAGRLYGVNSEEQKIVKSSWKQVGIG